MLNINLSHDQLVKLTAVAKGSSVHCGKNTNVTSVAKYFYPGVYNDPQCSSVKHDHAVFVVGYGTLDNVDYWLVKNR